MKVFKPYQFKQISNYESIFCSSEDELKVGYININDIFTGRSIEFLNEDKNLLALDILVVADSRLTEETDEAFFSKNIFNWKVEHRFDSPDRLKHMGLLVLKSKMCSEMDLTIKEKQYFRKQNVHMQILFLTFHSYNLETAFLYIRETPNQEETKVLKKDLEKVDLVMGDLNIDADDPKRIADKKKLDTLCVKRTRILREVTTTRYNQLDHIL